METQVQAVALPGIAHTFQVSNRGRDRRLNDVRKHFLRRICRGRTGCRRATCQEHQNDIYEYNTHVGPNVNRLSCRPPARADVQTDNIILLAGVADQLQAMVRLPSQARDSYVRQIAPKVPQGSIRAKRPPNL